MKACSFVESCDVSTRGKRRAALSHAIGLLEKIRKAEEVHIDRVPQNLQGSDAFAAAEDSLAIVSDAICFLEDAY